MKHWRIAGVNFDHMHMGDLLRQVHEHPDAQIVGVCDTDRARMQGSIANFAISDERVFTDLHQCLKTTQPDIVILCPKTGEHADYVEAVAPYGVHVIVEKPFAASLADADRMMRAMEASGKRLVINWPLAWYPPHITTHRLITEGVIGQVREVHYYDGNRGPLRHVADKVEISEADAARHKSESWWYQKAMGGGSLLDYLGYGVTLGTWFHQGQAPLEVTCTVDAPPGLDVDEHSITVCRYATGLSKYETRWGTFTDPWTHQPQPKCGFVVVGMRGTIASYDYEPTIRVQTEAHPDGEIVPVDVVPAPRRSVVEHVLDVLENGTPLHGPLDPTLCRIGQQIVDSAVLSSRENRTVPLLP